MALEEKEPPEHASPDSKIASAIRERLADGELACADAFVIAQTLDVDPRTVGKTADLMRVKLSRCQLGLFGYRGKHGWRENGVDELRIPDGLEAATVAAGQPRGALSCIEAWRLAAEFGISRMQMGWVAEQRGVKIASCQLGAF